MIKNLIDFQKNFEGFEKESDKETGETGGDRGRHRETEGDRGRQQGDKGRQRETKGDPPSQHQKKNRKIEKISIFFLFFHFRRE